MKRHLLVLTLLAAVLGAGALPFAGTASAATRTHAHSALFNRTRFVADLGIAFYAFHHFCYNAQKAGAFQKGAKRRTLNIVKCGAALLVAIHFVRRAQAAANSSSSRTLHVLVKPINALGSLYSSAGARLKSGVYNPIDITNLNRAVTSVATGARLAGYRIVDRAA
ncbi:MAG: hypothetical protein NVSMB52_02520 [Chloroflexota bacterium]